MPLEWLPGWLLWGLAITGVLTVVFAAVFAVGEYLFPTTPVEQAHTGSGEWKRRQEIREFLTAARERYVEDHVVAGQRVAFYLPERDVAITFDAMAYFRIEKTDSYAILVEHEMPGAHLGTRLPFETPDAFANRPSEDAVAAAFRTLDLPPDADREAVTAAYREKIKEVHPDHGGDERAFRQVREAYTTAKEAAS